MEYVNNSLQKHLGQPIELSGYEGDESPKTKALEKSTSQETPVQMTETANNQPSKPQTTINNQAKQATDNKLINLLTKVWRLFRKP